MSLPILLSMKSLVQMTNSEVLSILCFLTELFSVKHQCNMKAITLRNRKPWLYSEFQEHTKSERWVDRLNIATYHWTVFFRTGMFIFIHRNGIKKEKLLPIFQLQLYFDLAVTLLSFEYFNICYYFIDQTSCCRDETQILFLSISLLNVIH